VTSAEDAARLLEETAAPGDLILVKGSRSARMEGVLEAFSQSRSAAEVMP
jgi:UDP-N-acetylmuramyl pentapeptide synthase